LGGHVEGELEDAVGGFGEVVEGCGIAGCADETLGGMGGDDGGESFAYA